MTIFIINITVVLETLKFIVMACKTKKKKMRQGGGVSGKIKKESAMKDKKRLGGGISPKIKKRKITHT